MCDRPALSPGDLALWLRDNLALNVDALTDLVLSGDVKIVSTLDEFTVMRGHYESEIRIRSARLRADDGIDDVVATTTNCAGDGA